MSEISNHVRHLAKYEYPGGTIEIDPVELQKYIEEVAERNYWKGFNEKNWMRVRS